MHPGAVAGIIGGLVGVAGGLFGTWCSIRNTEGPRERAFMIKWGILFWTGGVLLVAGLLCWTSPYRWLLVIPYGIMLPFAIRYGNRRQRLLRMEEARERAEENSFP